jgi:predicted ATPase
LLDKKRSSSLDNCEQVVDATAQLVDALLHGAPGLHVLATSREPLGVPGEVAWRVPSLDDDAAVELFMERARQVRPGYNVTTQEAVVVSDICRRLDGLPLAIELAAAQIRMMHPTPDRPCARRPLPVADWGEPHRDGPSADARGIRGVEP